MGLFWQNNRKTGEDKEELEHHSTKLKQSLTELECEEAIIDLYLIYGFRVIN